MSIKNQQILSIVCKASSLYSKNIHIAIIWVIVQYALNHVSPSARTTPNGWPHFKSLRPSVVLMMPHG